MEPLEERRLLTVSAPQADAMLASALAASPAEVVGRHVFYNNSRFDGHNPTANAADDAAIAPDKQALLPGQRASFANYTSYSAGLNGVMIDIAGLAGTPTLADFQFRTGNDNAPQGWALAPTPTGFLVRPGAGVNGSTRITFTWADNVIEKAWLQVIVRPTANTGLARSDVFFFGNAIGDTGNASTNTLVNTTDQLGARANPRGLNDPAPITSPYDFNRDGLVSMADEGIARVHATTPATMLNLISVAPNFAWAEVVGRQVFYNNSRFDGNNIAPGVADDAAIATDKRPLLPGQQATFANYTSYSRGLNGVMLDVANLITAPTAADFRFLVGNNNDPRTWTPGPAPSSITVRWGAGVGGSARVTLIWPDNAIQKQWLQVAFDPLGGNRLTAADVFYFGNAIGETGDAAANAIVDSADEQRIQQAGSVLGAPVSHPLDINRDGFVNVTDVLAARANAIPAAAALSLIRPPDGSVPVAMPAAVTETAQSAYVDFAQARIAGRHVFYNNSNYDGNRPQANAGDDNAIAPDKRALLPGQTASWANFTNYGSGLNGIMVDIAGLAGTLTAADFEFRMGNSANPDQWQLAPAPASISQRAGAGAGGSTRVTIIWPDNLLQNTWLRVTVKATANTALKQADVFYFGNLLGESGNSTMALVNITDQTATRNASYSWSDPAPLTSAIDYNRDRIVDIADEWIAARSMGKSLTMFTAPPAVAPPPVEPLPEPAPLFGRGDGGFNFPFAPTLVRATDGTLLAIAEGRSKLADTASNGLYLRRSFDGGLTWSPFATITSLPEDTVNYIGNPSAVVDETTGEIFLLFTRNNSEVFVTSSRDQGLTWSTPQEITASVKVTSDGNPNPAAFSSIPWGWYATGPSHGIQIQKGPYAGRLLIACDHRYSADLSGISWSHVIYSDDHGRTWRLGGGLDETNPANGYSNEVSIVEQSDGGLYMSVRVNNSDVRGYTRSYDGGLTWSTMRLEPSLTTFPVQAPLLRVNATTVLLAAPDPLDSLRNRMTIWISRDDMQTWQKTKVVFFGYASYSDMVLVGPDTVLLAYNFGRTNESGRHSVGLVRFNLEWLLSDAPYQFEWHFNEGAIGEAANLSGPTIRDYSLWDNRAQAKAASPAEAPRYVAGPSGNTALQLTTGSDLVELTPTGVRLLQFEANESFTIEMTIRTTGSNGVILGSRADLAGIRLMLVNGRVDFKADDRGVARTSLQSSMRIDDGQWHKITVIRNAVTRQFYLMIDGFTNFTGGTDRTTGPLRNRDAITLGAYNDGTSQLAMDIDYLRVTHAALNFNELTPLLVKDPARPAPPNFGAGAPNTLPGLKLWLPAYAPGQYFADLGVAEPLAISPAVGTATRSAKDVSPNKFVARASADTREVLYAYDDVVGPSWKHQTSSSAIAQGWKITNSNGTSPANFDFVQNTGEFSLSTFVKLGDSTGNNMALFDTAESKSSNNGFSLLARADGSLQMSLFAKGTARYNQVTAPGLLAKDTWYHVAVVGQGAGGSVTFYVTPVGAAQVAAYQPGGVIGGVNGAYPTNAAYDLHIGGLAGNGYAAFNGNMVNQAIYDRALTRAEIQQLFDYVKRP